MKNFLSPLRIAARSIGPKDFRPGWCLCWLLTAMAIAEHAHANRCEPASFFFNAQVFGDGKRFLGSGFEQTMTSDARARPAEVKWDLVMRAAGPRALKVYGTYNRMRYPDGPKPIHLFDFYFDPSTGNIINNASTRTTITPVECTSRSLQYLEQDPSAPQYRRRVTLVLGLHGQLRVRVAEEMRDMDSYITDDEMDGALFAR